MVDLPRSEILGWLEDPVTGEPIEAAEAENFTRCPACGGMIDCQDLAIVIAHLTALPHPGQDQTS